MAEGGAEQQPTGAQPGARDVFISYASQDTAVAEAVCAALERDGVMCWIAPRDVTPGAHYSGEIVHAIDGARAIVLVLSQDAAVSPHVLREVERATSRRHPVVVLRIDLAPLPAELEYFLNTSQWLDASGGDTARLMPKLIAGVRTAIKAPLATPAKAPMPHASVPSAPARLPKRGTIIVASLVGLMLSGFLVDRLWLSSRRAVPTPAPVVAASTTAPITAPAAIPEKSVAVLPFVDQSEKRDQQYLAEGMTEGLTTLLLKLPQLSVIGRSSSSRFKGSTEDLPAIGAKLGAAYLVAGTVGSAGSRVRVSARLIESRSGGELWAENYDREFGDVLALQDQISTRIARALQITLTAEDVMPQRRLRSSEAYKLYLRGLSAYDKMRPDVLSEAQSYFEQALALDQSFVHAAEGLALTHVAQATGETIVPRSAWQSARRAAELALRIDSKSTSAHAVEGLVKGMLDFDWDAAEAELGAALALNERDPVAWDFAARVAHVRGQTDLALRRIGASLALDPLNPYALDTLGQIFFAKGDLDAAEKAYRRLADASPAFDGNHQLLAEILVARGDREGALREAEAEVSVDARDQARAVVYHALGRESEAKAALERILPYSRDIWPNGIATVYARRGDLDKAFFWYDRARVQRDPELPMFIRADFFFGKLRGDPRYKTLLAKMNLTE